MYDYRISIDNISENLQALSEDAKEHLLIHLAEALGYDYDPTDGQPDGIGFVDMMTFVRRDATK